MKSLVFPLKHKLSPFPLFFYKRKDVVLLFPAPAGGSDPTELYPNFFLNPLNLTFTYPNLSLALASGGALTLRDPLLTPVLTACFNIFFFRISIRFRCNKNDLNKLFVICVSLTLTQLLIIIK